MPWEKDTLFLWGTGTFCLRASATTAYFLALLTRTGGRGEERRWPRGESDSSEEQKGTCWELGVGGGGHFNQMLSISDSCDPGVSRDCTQSSHRPTTIASVFSALRVPPRPSLLCPVGLRQHRTRQLEEQ